MHYSVAGIITTYNRDADVVEKAIKSIINQTYNVSEIIVVDDNPNNNAFSDRIRLMCNKYFQVDYIKQDGNKGACAARNLGIKNCKSDLIGFLDDDDEWLADKIEKQVAVFENSNEKIGIVYCSGNIRFLPSNKEIDYYTHKNFKEYMCFSDILEGDWIGSTSNPLIKKECFDVVGSFGRNNLQDKIMKCGFEYCKNMMALELKKNYLFIQYMMGNKYLKITENHIMVIRIFTNDIKNFIKEILRQKSLFCQQFHRMRTAFRYLISMLLFLELFTN